MIKNLKRENVLNVPFVVSSNLTPQNVHPFAILLFNSGSYTASISTTYLDYGDGSSSPELVTSSLLALSQQTENFLWIEEGVYQSYPIISKEYQNHGGKQTYKPLLYSSIKNLLYSDTINELGQDKILNNVFVSFTVPSIYLQDGIKPGSISFPSILNDEEFVIVDDAYGNLIVQNNIFVKYQNSRELVMTPYSNVYTGSTQRADIDFISTTSSVDYINTTSSLDAFTEPSLVDSYPINPYVF